MKATIKQMISKNQYGNHPKAIQNPNTEKPTTKLAINASLPNLEQANSVGNKKRANKMQLASILPAK